MPSKMPVWLRLILALAVVRILTGIAGYWLGGPVAPAESAATSAPSLPMLLDILAFSAGAGLLLVGGREDPRARYLGAFFLVLATSLTNWSTGALATRLDGTARELVTAVKGLQADAFLPLLLWLFVREFPHSPGAREHRRLELGVWLSAAYGLILFTANLVKVLPQLDERGLNVKIVACISPQLFAMQDEAYRRRVVSDGDRIDGMAITNRAFRLMHHWIEGPIAREYSLASDWDDRWRTGGSVDDVIDEAHLAPHHIVEAIERFVGERERRLARWAEDLAAARGR